MMMIFDRWQLGIVILNKVGSTTIRNEFRNVLTGPAYRIGPDIPQSYECMCFIRNPLARAASLWQNQMQIDNVLPCFKRLGFYEHMPMSEFVDVMVNLPGPDKDLDPHIRPQAGQIPHGSSLFLLEEFRWHWPLFCREFERITGKILNREPPQRNRTGVKYRDVMSDLDMMKITQRYAEDVSMWEDAAEEWKKILGR